MTKTAKASNVEREARAIVERLGGIWSGAGGMCCCPAHKDRTPSLSIRAGRSRVLLHCFAGCDPHRVLRVLAETRLLEPIAGIATQSEPPDQASRSMAAAALGLWREAWSLEATPASRYLAARGLPAASPELRFHALTPFGRSPSTIFAPALIAAVRDNAGLVAVHRTRLAGGDETMGFPRKAALGPLGSGAIRLGPAGGCLGLAEGIENALAATVLTGVPCWATLGAERFGRVALPPQVRRLILFLDNDAGGRRAEALAGRAYSEHLEIEIRRPARPGFDWNDVLQADARCASPEQRRGGG